MPPTKTKLIITRFQVLVTIDSGRFLIKNSLGWKKGFSCPGTAGSKHSDLAVAPRLAVVLPLGQALQASVVER